MYQQKVVKIFGTYVQHVKNALEEKKPSPTRLPFLSAFQLDGHDRGAGPTGGVKVGKKFLEIHD